MAARSKGEDLAAVRVAGRLSTTSAAVPLTSSIFANSCSSEFSIGQTSRLLQTDFRSTSSHSTNKVGVHIQVSFAALKFYSWI